jgi:hypothetical protein
MALVRDGLAIASGYETLFTFHRRLRNDTYTRPYIPPLRHWIYELETFGYLVLERERWPRPGESKYIPLILQTLLANAPEHDGLELISVEKGSIDTIFTDVIKAVEKRLGIFVNLVKDRFISSKNLRAPTIVKEVTRESEGAVSSEQRTVGAAILTSGMIIMDQTFTQIQVSDIEVEGEEQTETHAAVRT